MNIIISNNSSVPIYEQIKNAIKNEKIFDVPMEAKYNMFTEKREGSCKN